MVVVQPQLPVLNLRANGLEPAVKMEIVMNGLFRFLSVQSFQVAGDRPVYPGNSAKLRFAACPMLQSNESGADPDHNCL